MYLPDLGSWLVQWLVWGVVVAWGDRGPFRRGAVPNSHLSLLFLGTCSCPQPRSTGYSQFTYLRQLQFLACRSQFPRTCPHRGGTASMLLIHSPLLLEFRSNLPGTGAKMKTSAPGRTCSIATVLLSLLAVLHTSTPQKVVGVRGGLSVNGVS